MEPHVHTDNLNSHHESWLKKHRWITFVALGVIAIYLFTEHKQHVLPMLPYLFLLACPLMHVFMHGGHKHHESK